MAPRITCPRFHSTGAACSPRSTATRPRFPDPWPPTFARSTAAPGTIRSPRATAGPFPTRPVPRALFPPLAGLDVLGLASGGGQQGPVLAAAGARVTVLDNSPRQLGQDRMVADRDGLSLTTVEGDMASLPFEDASFDLIFHP